MRFALTVFLMKLKKEGMSTMGAMFVKMAVSNKETRSAWTVFSEIRDEQEGGRS